MRHEEINADSGVTDGLSTDDPKVKEIVEHWDKICDLPFKMVSEVEFDKYCEEMDGEEEDGNWNDEKDNDEQMPEANDDDEDEEDEEEPAWWGGNESDDESVNDESVGSDSTADRPKR
jgi:hypothetical protein